MINFSHLLFCLIVLAGSAFGVSKPHAIAFSKWTAVKWYIGSGDSQPLDLKIRTLYVDGRAKEFTAGPVHDITDHLFVVRRVFRVNDSLPQEQETVPRWRWQRGGWLLVSRITGHISSFSLPGFDSYYSVASWYRDYVAYCGVAEEGHKINALIVQLGRRKPILKKAVGETARGEMAYSCQLRRDNPVPLVVRNLYYGRSRSGIARVVAGTHVDGVQATGSVCS